MVDQEIVFDTIKKMKESGLEDDIIISTLQDIGLDEPQAREYIQKIASGENPSISSNQAVPVQPAQQVSAQAPVFDSELKASVTPVQAASTQSSNLQNQKTTFNLPFQASNAQFQSGQTERLDDDTAAAIEEAFEGAIQNEQASTQSQKPFQSLSAQPVSNSNKEMLNLTQQIQNAPIPQTRPGSIRQQTQQFPEEVIATKAAEKVREHISVKSEEDAMRHAATQSQLSDQTRQLTEMQSKINKIVKTKPIQMPAGTPPEIIALSKEIEQLRVDVSETKAISAATKALMEKILEANRKILNRLP